MASSASLSPTRTPCPTESGSVDNGSVDGTFQSSLDVQGGRVKDGYLNILLLNEHRYFGASQDHTLGPLCLKVSYDALELLFGKRKELSPDQLLVDAVMHQVAIFNGGDDHIHFILF